MLSTIPPQKFCLILVNLRKVYAIDTGLAQVNSQSFSDDHGRKLENLVFLHLRRKYTDIYYYLEKGECDFIVSKMGAINDAIQVCYELTTDNLDRELKGVLEALEFFDLNEGTIITFNQEDYFEKGGRKVKVVPSFKYMSE